MTDVTNDVFSYSLDLECWIKVIDSWYFNVGKEEIKCNVGGERMYERLRVEFEEDALMENINTYKFDDNTASVLKDTMVGRSKEMITMMQ